MGRDSTIIVPKVGFGLYALLIVETVSPDFAPEGRRYTRHALWVRSGINVHRGAEGVKSITGRGEQDFERGDGVTGLPKGLSPAVGGLALHTPFLEDPVSLSSKLTDRENRERGVFVKEIGVRVITCLVGAIALLYVDGFEDRKELGQVVTIAGNFPSALLADVTTRSIEAFFIDR